MICSLPVTEPYPPQKAAWYVVGVLTLIYVFSFIDRQILNLLVGPIRRDLQISDTQMSLLMGFTFAVFYTFFGIPLGRMADSGSRRTIIAAGLAVWSLFTTGCGLAKTFGQMALMRIGVGVGEASLSPSAYSLISDYFPPERRATAISVYGMGIYIGSGLASLFGGLVIKLASQQEMWTIPVVGEVRPWQTIFFAVGLPGLLLAPIMFTIAEPVRRGVKKAGAAVVPFREVLAYIRENGWTFLCHNFGISFVAVTTYGSSSWLPTMFQRVHHWSAADIGIRYGVVVAIFGTLGIVCGGRFADYLRSRGYRDASMRVMWLAPMCYLPFTLCVTLIPDPWVSYCFLVPSVFFSSTAFGVAPAAITEIMPNAMRGQAAASYLFVNNLIGLGLGPTAVAMATDFVFHDDTRVNHSLALVATCALTTAAILLRLGLPQFVKSLDRLKEYGKGHASGV